MNEITVISDVVVEVVDTNDEVHEFVLEAPTATDPFTFEPRRIKISPDYRDRNFVQRLGREVYEILFRYSYVSHEMDLRVLLTSKQITLKAPPDFIGEYSEFEVMYLNEDAIRDYISGLAVGGQSNIPGGDLTIEFQTKKPLEWEELLGLKWSQEIIELIPDPPENFSVDLIDE